MLDTESKCICVHKNDVKFIKRKCPAADCALALCARRSVQRVQNVSWMVGCHSLDYREHILFYREQILFYREHI